MRHTRFAATLTAAAAALTLTACGNSSGTGAPPPPPDTPTATAATLPPVLDLGATATVPGQDNPAATADVIITDAQYLPAISGEQPERGDLWLLLTVTIVNTGDTAWVDPAQLAIQTPAGDVLDVGDAGVSGLTDDELGTGWVQLQPGQRATGTELYEVPEAARGGLVVYEGDDPASTDLPPARVTYARWQLPA